MTKLTRRAFTRLCGGTLAAQAVLSTWPAWADQTPQPSGAADSTDPLAFLSLTEASARIHARTVTSTQLTNALLARIKVYNPLVNAYVTVMSDDALRQAAELDAEQKAGKFRGLFKSVVGHDGDVSVDERIVDFDSREQSVGELG